MSESSDVRERLLTVRLHAYRDAVLAYAEAPQGRASVAAGGEMDKAFRAVLDTALLAQSAPAPLFELDMTFAEWLEEYGHAGGGHVAGTMMLAIAGQLRAQSAPAAEQREPEAPRRACLPCSQALWNRGFGSTNIVSHAHGEPCPLDTPTQEAP
jgi:hypothetical protein